jgi:drug/metabolite transporter (DMT)-like permease
MMPPLPDALALPQVPSRDPGIPPPGPDAADRSIDRLRIWWGGAAGNLRGSVLLSGAIVLFSVMLACIKEIGTGLPLAQVIVVRQVIVTVLLLPLFLPDLRSTFRTPNPGLQIVRGLFSLFAMLFGFTAVVHVPLADATALGFTKVLFVTVAAVFILKETVGPRRWLATGIGFLGVLVMLAPGGSGEVTPYHLLALLGAAFAAGISITIRMLSEREKTETILLYQSVVLIGALIMPALLWWEPPTGPEWFLLAIIGVSGAAAQYLVTRAYQSGEASALAPLDFGRLLIAVVIGFVFFAEVPNLRTLVGAMIILGATFYTFRWNSVTAV